MCVSTLLVTLPSKIAEIPLRPCEAMTMTSQSFSFAVVMIPLYAGHARAERFTGNPHRLSRIRDALQYSGSMFFSLLDVLA